MVYELVVTLCTEVVDTFNPFGIFKSIPGGHSGGVGACILYVVILLSGSRGIRALLSAFMILCT